MITYRLGKRPVTTALAPCSPNPIPVVVSYYNCRRSSCTEPGDCTVWWSDTRRPRFAATRSGLPRPSCRQSDCRSYLKQQQQTRIIKDTSRKRHKRTSPTTSFSVFPSFPISVRSDNSWYNARAVKQDPRLRCIRLRGFRSNSSNSSSSSSRKG